jgi:hypothetical protein
LNRRRRGDQTKTPSGSSTHEDTNSTDLTPVNSDPAPTSS